MKRFVAVDTGKFGTKVAFYDEKNDRTKRFCIRTAHCDGDFRDDADARMSSNFPSEVPTL